MYLILENGAVMQDTDGNDLGYLTKQEALDTIGYFDQEVNEYEVKHVLDQYKTKD